MFSTRFPKQCKVDVKRLGKIEGSIWDKKGTIFKGFTSWKSIGPFAAAADLIILYSDGAAKVWKNTNNGKAFTALDANWATGLAPRANVHFEDIDGDGYADYVIVYSGGSVKWARNTHNNGRDSSKKNWESAATIAPGPAGIPADSARLRDVDGDGKADYLIVYDGGAVKALRNTIGDGNSRNWDDLGTIAPGVSGVTSEMVRFADMDGDGLSDFLAVADDGSIRMWKNLGIVGTKGSSMRFADLNGDGKDDIVSVDAKGRSRSWVNKGLSFEPIGEIAPGLNEDLSSARIEFADVNGDGYDDYIVIYGGGAVKAYLNTKNILTDGARNWQNAITISPGVGEPGSKVRFADLNGDGYDEDDKEEKETCRSASKTYYDKEMPEGYYMNWNYIDSQSVSIQGWQYITIVNLTPHTFKYDSEGSHHYQMTNWDFGDIPPGKSRQNAVEYSATAANKVDSKGEAYYSIEGTKDKFVVEVTNHDLDTYPKRIIFNLRGMGASWREYNCPKPETPVTLVITGSPAYEDGYITSLVHGGAGWMHNIKNVIRDRTLDQIVMPGSHDSGMSTITGALLAFGGTWQNAQTQNLNINSQLWAGARWFVLRIATIHKPSGSYEFYALHVNEETNNSPVGASGEKFSDIIDEINDFTSQFPGEVIILQFRYLLGLRESPIIGPIYWDDDLKDEFFDKLKEIKNRCGDLEHERRFHDYKLRTLTNMNSGKGCVLIFLDTQHMDQKIEEEDQIWEKEGIYRKNAMSIRDSWPNLLDTKAIAEYTIEKWKENTDSGMHIAQWLTTLPIIVKYSIMQIAILPTNPA
ncbi:hypothetical protein FAUST_4593 [Fusarium austroamericanum]|uniref:Uncharacterized protein n=1 Tax=Fusarium austroamericanum TaxID=282268 RepID=A0AAN6C2S4_FUSAU|nr:hypothetical protein FAUST_4593 [Fusarium austroamericanum]